jgi:broad specificity phosphatase PhoE
VTATIFLLRHAAHDNVGGYLAGRMAGINLGPDGLAQADRLGERMRAERFDALYASPRERTQQTAAAVAKARGGMAVETVEALDEVDFGTWSGSTFDELNTLPDWRHWNERRSMATTPAGDTMLAVQQRAVGFIRPFAAGQEDSRIALVSHADVIRALVAHVLGLPVDSWQRFDISPASITTMVIGPWGGKLLTINEVTP